jgi:hypothetical protein
MKIKFYRFPQSGRCRVCGCTDDRACAAGCCWVDRKHTLCSECQGTVADLIWTLRDTLARLQDEINGPRTGVQRKRWLGKAATELRGTLRRYRHNDGVEVA